MGGPPSLGLPDTCSSLVAHFVGAYSCRGEVHPGGGPADDRCAVEGEQQEQVWVQRAEGGLDAAVQVLDPLLQEDRLGSGGLASQ